MTLRSILMRISAPLRRRSLDAALDEEVSGHLDLLARDYERRGLAPEQARLAARRDFGGVEQMKETYRDRSGLRWLDDARRDVHHAFRTLRRSPVFTGAAVLTLAIGLTAVTGIYAILNAFVLRSMPVSHPEQLVSIGTGPDTHVQIPHGISFVDLQDYRKDRSAFDDLLGYCVAIGGLNSDNSTERITMYGVTDNYFSMLGVQPAIGRLIQPNEGRARGDAPVIVLTHEYWLSRFGGDPSVVGRRVRVTGRPFTIIGVTPKPFDKAHTLIYPSAYIPLWMYDDVMNLSGESILERRDSHQLWVLGRLKPGVSLSQASASLQVTTSGLAKAYPSTNKDTALVVVPETHARPNPNIGPVFRVAATAFAALAVLLLLITSANVTNLLMARAVSREREVSLRAALGAGRGRLVRQLLTESIVLALFASAVALPIAALALQNFQQGFAASTAIATLRPDFSLDVRVLIGVLGLTLLAGVVSGLAPALMAARADLNGALKSGSRGASGEPRAWFRSALVVGQVALTLMLLVSGGLFVRSLDHVRRVQLGFDPQHVVVASAVPGESGYDPEQRSAYFTAARDRVLTLPGVDRAAWAAWIPIATVSDGGPFWLESRPPRADEQPQNAATARVDPGYFAAANTPILEGRAFTDRDDAQAAPVTIVNQTLAAQLWPTQSALGRFFVLEGTRVQVVGVVPNGKYYFVWEAPRAMAYRPLAQNTPLRATLVVRSSRPPSELIGDLQRTLRFVDPAVFVYDVRTMDQHLAMEGGGFAAFSIGATVTSVFGTAGLLLAAVGLYGMMAGRVSQRTKEFGVRIALGADRRAILRDVLGRAIRLASIGIVGGAVLAAFAAQGLSALLLDVSPFDPLTYGLVAVVLTSVCALASFIPARRATRVDPIVALRAE
ncbi:MAG TPA: ABC transporter permease [Vicinamibacterales bacterium]|nr:ABC transporter permease [Vicinamibacterales bacterium]